MLVVMEKRLTWPTVAIPPPPAFTLKMLVFVVQVYSRHTFLSVEKKMNYAIILFFCLFNICTEHTGARENCTDGDLRLRGGTTFREGRLEICYERKWGTVCDNNLEAQDAQVACRQLGFSSYGKFH